VAAPSRQDMEKRSHTIRSTAIPSTGQGTGPPVSRAAGAAGAAGTAGTAITGTATAGTVHMDADMDVGADMAAEAGMA
jgi:hypothetical protein